MKQGTISVLFGCHSVVHSILVTISWKILYKQWPKFWELCCIFLHDIGYINKNYLSNKSEKHNHWILGAKIANIIFGKKGFNLTAGHCSYSNKRKSKLYKADKYSWYIAPKWWLYMNCFFEPPLKCGYNTIKESVNVFKEDVRCSIESGNFTSTHDMYLKRKNEGKKDDR